MNNRKWSRIIAMLLAVMLVFCDSNVILCGGIHDGSSV